MLYWREEDLKERKLCLFEIMTLLKGKDVMEVELTEIGDCGGVGQWW